MTYISNNETKECLQVSPAVAAEGFGEAWPAAMAGGTAWALGTLCCWFAGKGFGDPPLEGDVKLALSWPANFKWLALSTSSYARRKWCLGNDFERIDFRKNIG